METENLSSLLNTGTASMSDPPTTLPIDHDMDSSHSGKRVKLQSAIRYG